MKETHNGCQRSRARRALLAVPLALLLAGCGPDKPYDGPPPGYVPDTQTAPSGSVADSTPPPSAADPLLSGAGGASGDPLVGKNSLIGNNSLTGPTMPTAHSHWLRGYVRDAHVTVLLNGIRHGKFSGILDRDITMKLRAGINKVTFQYQPNSLRSGVNLEIVESEHDPPIAPLVTFQSLPPSLADGNAPLPVTKTFMFVAN